LSVLHVGPDPKRAFVVRSHVISSDQLGSIIIVAFLGGFTEFAVSPLDRFIVDLGTALANFISLMEVSVG